MRTLLILAMSLSLVSCMSFYKKGYDVRKAADNLNGHIAEQKAKLSTNYKEHVRFYRALIKSGLRKNQKPMPQLLDKTLEMKKLAVEANALMKKIRLRTTRMRQIADGKKRIPDSDPEYAEIDELKEGIESLIVDLEKVAKKYGEASEAFSSIARDNDLYLIRPEKLRLQAEQYEAALIARGNEAKENLKKARARAQTAGQKQIVNEMSGVLKEILNKGRAIQILLDKLLNRLDSDEVAVGPHSDPKVTLNRIKALMEEMQELKNEYAELAKSF